MEALPKDVVEEITKKLSVKDFLNFCETKSRFCVPDVWKRRLYHDYPFVFTEESLRDPKYTYLKITEIISKGAEELERTELENKNSVEYWFDLIVKNIIYIFKNVDINDFDEGEIDEFGFKHLTLYVPWLNENTHGDIVFTSAKVFKFLNYIDETGSSTKKKDEEDDDDIIYVRLKDLPAYLEQHPPPYPGQSQFITKKVGILPF